MIIINIIFTDNYFHALCFAERVDNDEGLYKNLMTLLCSSPTRLRLALPQDINNIYQQPSTVLFQSLIFIDKTADKCYLTEGVDYACIRKCQQLMESQRFYICFQLLMINEPHILIVRSMPEFG